LLPMQTVSNLGEPRMRSEGLLQEPGYTRAFQPGAGLATADMWLSYMRSNGSIPSMASPAASARFVIKHKASRESRTAPEDCSTGHCS